MELAGESLLTIGRDELQLDGLCVFLGSVPHLGVEAFQATMQAVGAVVDGQLIIDRAVDLEPSLGDAVAVATANRSEVRLLGGEVVGDGFMAGDYIGQLPVSIGHHE